MNLGVSNFVYNNSVKKSIFQDSRADVSHQSTPSFGASNPDRPDGITPEQAAALAAQRMNQKKSIPHITENDINFEVTWLGHGQVKGNTRKIYDYRCSMQAAYGLYWYKNFYNPHIVRNGNIDEKRNGETTALVIPLDPDTLGLRGADHMAMVLNGRIEKPVLDELVVYMAKIGVLNDTPKGKFKYYVNSLNPKDFMANPKIKTAIAQFFQRKEAEQANAAANTQSVNDDKADSKLKPSDINIVNIGQKQDRGNTRTPRDYIRDFLQNGKKFTVIHDKYTQNNTQKDMTAILIPSPKSDWDCITVTIDRNLPQQECKNLINHLVRSKMANIENENFRNAIVDYFNSKEK